MDANDMKLLGKRMPTEDVISRAEAIETVTKCNAKAMSGFDWIRMQEAADELRKLPSAQPEQLGMNLAEVGTDMISRQAAIDALENTKEVAR